MRLTQKLADASLRTQVGLISLFGLVMSDAWAVQQVDMTQDPSGGKKLTDLATNVDTTQQTIAGVFVAVCGLIGIFLIAGAIMGFVKAGKDHNGQHGTKGPIIMLVAGGAMLAITFIAWMVRNSLVG